MTKFIEITDMEKMQSVLASLENETPANWGKMNAQNMIEHLLESVEHSSGKKTSTMVVGKETAEIQKQYCVRNDFEIPQGTESIQLSDTTKSRRFEDLTTAIEFLKKEINVFQDFLGADGSTAVHPAFGPMDFEDWRIWHGKHFTHHFKQFNLL